MNFMGILLMLAIFAILLNLNLCEFVEVYDNSTDYYKNWSDAGGVPHYLTTNFPLASAQYGVCMFCNRTSLTEKYMHHTGICSKSLCESRYQYLFACNYGNRCGVCGRVLQENKILNLRNNPREVRFHIHEGECLAAYALGHTSVVDMQRGIRQWPRLVDYGWRKEDAIYESGQNNIIQSPRVLALPRTTPTPNNRQRALPYCRMTTVDEWRNQNIPRDRNQSEEEEVVFVVVHED